MTSYAEKLRDVRWQQKRLEVLEDADWVCEKCGGDGTLNVHHYWYEPSKNPWEYERKCYGVLCDECHIEWHEKKLQIDKMLATPSVFNLNTALGLVSGFRMAAEQQDLLLDDLVECEWLAGFIRGFWLPAYLQKPLLDRCLSVVNKKEQVWFSDVVIEVVGRIGEEEQGLASLNCWLKSVQKARRCNG